MATSRTLGTEPGAGRIAAARAPEIRRMTRADVLDALRQGLEDFRARPSHYAFVAVVYPVIGFALFAWASRGDALELVYPLVAGFALVGPIAALGPYEISRRRERGLDASWGHALDVFRSPALPSLLAVGVVLLLLFGAWIAAAEAIYLWTLGPGAASSLPALAGTVFGTAEGWSMLLVGNLVGFLFALAALCVSVVSLPLLLDRPEIGAAEAVTTSVRAVRRNPGPMLLWGLIVAGVLLLGAIPALAGLIVALPVLGHATWHIYRKAVVDGRPAAR